MDFVFQRQIIPDCSVTRPIKNNKKREYAYVLWLSAAKRVTGSAWQQPGGYVLFVTEGHVLLGLSGQYPCSPSLA